MTKTTIIAEMAWAHDGSLDKALRILQGAQVAGAQAIGIHITSLPDYMVPYYGSGTGKVSAGKEHLEVYKYLVDINLKPEDWMKFAAEAKKIKMDLCVMANDLPSLQFAATELKPAYYVLSPASFVEPDFLDAVASLNQTTLLRIGGATLGEIEATIHRLRRQNNKDLVLLHGFQNYPTKLEETNLWQLVALQQMFNTPVGLADHIDGGDPLAQTIPLLAIPLGATFIEKHITFDRAEKGEDFESALDPQQFKQFVDNIRAAEIAMGQKGWTPLSEATQRYRQISRKKIVARRALKAGEKITQEDLAFKRSDVGLSADSISLLIGRELNRPIQENDGIVLEDCR